MLGISESIIIRIEGLMAQAEGSYYKKGRIAVREVDRTKTEAGDIVFVAGDRLYKNKRQDRKRSPEKCDDILCTVGLNES
jgi:hypothetical protein